MGSHDDSHRAISALATRQHGYVTRRQLLDGGMDRRKILRRAAQGWFIERHRDVFAVGHVPRSQVSSFHAAVLAFDDAVLGYRAAGVLWGLLRGPVPLEVTVATTAGLAHRDGIIVHRQPLPAEHRRTRDGVPVTSLVRTLLDLAAVLRGRRLAAAFEEAQVLHHLDPALLGAEVLCRRGHRGTARLRDVLADAVDPAGVRSILELRFLRLCDRHGIPRPVVNERRGPWELDFSWPEAGLVVETDGWAFHRTAAKRREAARKDAELHAMGLRVLRLTWSDVVERPTATAALLLSALTVAGRPL